MLERVSQSSIDLQLSLVALVNWSWHGVPDKVPE